MAYEDVRQEARRYAEHVLSFEPYKTATAHRLVTHHSIELLAAIAVVEHRHRVEEQEVYGEGIAEGGTCLELSPLEPAARDAYVFTKVGRVYGLPASVVREETRSAQQVLDYLGAFLWENPKG